METQLIKFDIYKKYLTLIVEEELGKNCAIIVNELLEKN